MQTNIPIPNRKVIQGGMGVYISNPFLAKAVSCSGGLGTVSMVASERILARILQSGDVGGHYRRVLARFPFPEFSEMVLKEFFIEEGNPKGLPKRAIPMFTLEPSKLLIALTVCSNYAFVSLAKEGHDNPVSINYLHDIEMPHIYALTGAIMAGVDFVTMGAGMPRDIPRVMRSIVEGGDVTHNVPVIGTKEGYMMVFHLENFFGRKLTDLKLPGFIPIISSNLLAEIFVKKLPAGSVQAFVVEESTAGGHNAPPRVKVKDEHGNILPIYGERDMVDYHELAKLGIPFWIGGSYASPKKLKWALSVGASGIQVGSIFALCDESGKKPSTRAIIRDLGYRGELKIRTDMRISPKGFPFKVVELAGTISDPNIYNARERICDQGVLVSPYIRSNGTKGYRCPSEPIENYLRKGGKLEDTVGRGCICNALLSNAGFENPGEPGVSTLGDDDGFLKESEGLMKSSDGSYTVAQALAYLQGQNF